jgi:hypothetical protein
MTSSRSSQRWPNKLESNIQSADDGTGEAFWKAPLNTTQVRNFSSNPIISFVAPDTTLTVDDMVVEFKADVMRQKPMGCHKPMPWLLGLYYINLWSKIRYTEN